MIATLKYIYIILPLMTNNVMLTFGVADTMPRFTNSIEQDN